MAIGQRQLPFRGILAPVFQPRHIQRRGKAGAVGAAHAVDQHRLGGIAHDRQQIVQRQLQVAPTLTIRPGFPVRIIVTRDLVFEPAGG